MKGKRFCDPFPWKITSIEWPTKELGKCILRVFPLYKEKKIVLIYLNESGQEKPKFFY